MIPWIYKSSGRRLRLLGDLCEEPWAGFIGIVKRE